jgi:glycosyltransferase involved in cell wall biosynthesis
MRIAFLSNAPWANTGYGMQVKQVSLALKAAGHEVAIQAFYGHQGSPIDWNGIAIYGGNVHPFGFDVMHAHARNFKADILISNMDSWVIEPSLMFDTRWVAWFPVDSEPCPPQVIDRVRQAWHRIVWTQHGKNEMDKAGLDYDYIPYGVDVEVFKPGDKTEARATAQMAQDKFIVGMVAMNKGFPSRKAFQQNIEAFKIFHDKHPDSLLYMHTLDGSRPTGESIDLAGFCKFLGLEPSKDVIFADQYSYVLGYPEAAMVTLYNCFDVHLLVSMGEGFGMPQLEAQACGVPVICGDWTTMPELCFSGWKVDRKDSTPFYTLQNTYQFLPNAKAIADKLEMAYQMRGNQDYARAARKGALKYDIKKVMAEHWTPVLAKLEQKIKDVPPALDNLGQNLAVLR